MFAASPDRFSQVSFERYFGTQSHVSALIAPYPVRKSVRESLFSLQPPTQGSRQRFKFADVPLLRKKEMPVNRGTMTELKVVV